MEPAPEDRSKSPSRLHVESQSRNLILTPSFSLSIQNLVARKSAMLRSSPQQPLYITLADSWVEKMARHELRQITSGAELLRYTPPHLAQPA